MHVLYNLNQMLHFRVQSVVLHCTVLSSTAASLRQQIGLLPTPQAWRSLGHNVPTPHPLKTNTHTHTQSVVKLPVCMHYGSEAETETVRSNVHILESLFVCRSMSAPDVGGPQSVETTQREQTTMHNIYTHIITNDSGDFIAVVIE